MSQANLDRWTKPSTAGGFCAADRRVLMCLWSWYAWKQLCATHQITLMFEKTGSAMTVAGAIDENGVSYDERIRLEAFTEDQMAFVRSKLLEEPEEVQYTQEELAAMLNHRDHKQVLLQAMCAHRGLSKSGTKAELADRLVAHGWHPDHGVGVSETPDDEDIEAAEREHDEHAIVDQGLGSTAEIEEDEDSTTPATTTADTATTASADTAAGAKMDHQTPDDAAAEVEMTVLPAYADVVEGDTIAFKWRYGRSGFGWAVGLVQQPLDDFQRQTYRFPARSGTRVQTNFDVWYECDDNTVQQSLCKATWGTKRVGNWVKLV